MDKLNYVMVFVSDMSRSVKFYRDVLGLPLRFESPCWSEFANEGTTIALHEMTAESGCANGEQAGHCRLGFQVADVDAIHRQLAAMEVACVDAPRVQTAGIRMATYRDPDGLTFSVAQARTRGA